MFKKYFIYYLREIYIKALDAINFILEKLIEVMM